MNDINYADSLKIEGNYNQAIKVYKELISLNNGLREKANLNFKIETAINYYNSITNISIGEAFFPVVNKANSNGIVLTGKVSLSQESNLSEEINERWKKIKVITANFLDKYLFEKIKTVMVLDWEIDKYLFIIKQIPNSSLDINKVVSGGSIELTMFISLISFILNQKIGNNFAFSGEVNSDFSVSYVDGIIEKTKVIDIERPMVKKFFIPPNTNSNWAFQEEVDSLEKIVTEVFPEFNKILKDKQNELGKRRLILKMSKVNNDKYNSIDYADFNFGDRNNIEEEEGEKVYSFLHNNIDKFKGCHNGLIISGLTISYSAPMLVAPLYNHTPKFLAIRYTQVKNLKSNEGAAYIILSNDENEYKPGEMFKFNLP